jgi:DNA-binding response OmpR family regulator
VDTDKKTILLIDDDKSIHLSLKMVFDSKKFRIVYASDCDAAVRKLHRGLICHIIILDIMMPGASGLNCLDILMEMKINAPILVLSALDSYRPCRAAFKKGAADYLTKPFDTDELLDTVNELLVRRRKKRVGR